MKLESIHERAIDLLVEGHRQKNVAKEIGVSSRTLRRWAEDDTFIKELEDQRDNSRNLATAQRSALNKLQAAVEMKILKRVDEVFDQPNPSDRLLTQCLRVVVAQQWREKQFFIKLDRAEAADQRLQQQTQAAEIRETLKAARATAEQPLDFMARIAKNIAAEKLAALQQDPQEKRPKADTSGQASRTANVSPASTETEPAPEVKAPDSSSPQTLAAETAATQEKADMGGHEHREKPALPNWKLKLKTSQHVPYYKKFCKRR